MSVIASKSSRDMLSHLLNRYTSWDELSSDTVIFDRSLVTREFVVEHRSRWNLKLLMMNPHFIRSSILDAELFDLLFNPLDRYQLVECHQLLFNREFMDIDFFDRHAKQWQWDNHYFIETVLSHPMIDPAFFDRYSDLWNWKLMSASSTLFNSKLMNSTFFNRYHYYWDWEILSINQALFNNSMFGSTFFNQYSKKWNWKSDRFIHLLISHSIMTEEFFDQHQLHKYPDALARSSATFKLPFMNMDLFMKIFKYHIPLALYQNEDFFDSPIIEDFFKLYYGNWYELSSSRFFFSSKVMTQEFFIDHIGDWKMELLAKNIHFFNCEMMTEEFFYSIRNKLNWRWMSRSKVIFHSKVMTPKVFRWCINYWNWNSVSRNGTLFTSKLMNEEFFIEYIDYWVWKQLSRNIAVITHPMVTKEFFNRYVNCINPKHKYQNCYNCTPKCQCWNMSKIYNRPKIDYIVDRLRGH